MSFEIMKTAIKLERSLTPKDNITSNSDFVVLKPISNDMIAGRFERGMCG